MKAGFVAVVVLSLAASSPANGQDPATGGVQCVLKCVVPDSADTSVARSAFQQADHSASASEDRKCTGNVEKNMACVIECQVDRYAVLAREVIRILENYCGDNVNPAKTTKFLTDSGKFNKLWFSARDKCKEDDTAEEACQSLSDCVFGSALTSVRYRFSDDVVSINVIFKKIVYAARYETRYGEGSSCDLLFEPNVPEPPYQPEPYPYETYSYEPYRRNPYQRNPYHRNPYQRNPYQRYPYRRNPY